LLLVIYSFTSSNAYLKIILALAAVAIHPLSGLPALFFVFWLELAKRKDRLNIVWYRFLNIITWISCTLSLPLSFAFINNGSWHQLSFSWQNLKSVFRLFGESANRDHVILNFFYLINNNWLIIFIIVIVVGWLIWFKKNQQEAWLLAKISSSLLIAFILSSSLSFSFLIDYERTNYSARLPILMGLFMIPAVLIFLDYLAGRVWKSDRIQIISGWLLISILLTTSLYLSYPRLDAYVNSKGFSVSKQDLTAVKSIEEKSTGKYIVLANQQTSVAALKELGFDHYFKNNTDEIFFYPIPTGGKLYQYYLKMVNENPSRKTMRSAMALAGVKESYFVVNKYWTFSNRLIAEAKLQADDFWDIDNGAIYIFKYKY
jgi:hypothetical protein